MQCDFCDNKATVYFTQILDGVTNKSCLCEGCASQQGVTDPAGFLLGKTPMPKVSPAEPSKPQSQEPQETPVAKIDFAAQASVGTTQCPSCGFAFDDLKKTGRLGCSNCYQHFREEIKHNLSGMHKGTHHAGRVPAGMLEAYQHQQRLDELQQQMHQAITNEDYEKAAALRDEIGKLSEESPLSQS